MRRLVLVAAILATAFAVAWWLPYVPGQVSVPMFFASGAIALLVITAPARRAARKNHH